MSESSSVESNYQMTKKKFSSWRHYKNLGLRVSNQQYTACIDVTAWCHMRRKTFFITRTFFSGVWWMFISDYIWTLVAGPVWQVLWCEPSVNTWKTGDSIFESGVCLAFTCTLIIFFKLIHVVARLVLYLRINLKRKSYWV